MIQFISNKQKLLLEHLLTPLGVKLVITDKSQFVTCKGQKALLVIRNGQLWLCRGLDQKWSQQDNLSKWINIVRTGMEIPELRNIPFLSNEEILNNIIAEYKIEQPKICRVLRYANDYAKAAKVWENEYKPLLGQVKTATLVNNFKQKIKLCKI